MGWKKKVSQYGRFIAHFRLDRSSLAQFRCVSRETQHTMSDMLRACVAALLSTEDRAKILRILKRHIPEAGCLAWAVS